MIFIWKISKRLKFSQKKRPFIWWCYVDDTFVLWEHNRGELNTFLDEVNEIEVEENNELNFLDILIQITGKTFGTTVYIKVTYTNCYLNYNSNHSISLKNIQ